jgi:hypothetical protein
MRLLPLSKLIPDPQRGMKKQMDLPFPDPDVDTSVYSNRLEELVKSLMELEPQARPALAHVKTEVQNALEAWERRLPGLKRKREDSLPIWMRVSTLPDDFVIGEDFSKEMSKRRRPTYEW